MSRFFRGGGLLLVLVATTVFCDSDHPDTLRRIHFGSCVLQSRAQPIFDTVVAANPDLFIFLGDNVYADTTDMEVMQRDYDTLAASPPFQRLRGYCPVLAVWDDHDYGANDAGSGYPKKAESEDIFLDFWGDPEGSPRRQRAGIYGAQLFGPPDRRVQVILLDTRTFRDPLVRGNPRPTDALGPYVANPDSTATILGEQQWLWLEEQLNRPARVRIVASSIQFIPEFSGWESWANFPFEKQRLLDLIAEKEIHGVLFISGDRHFAELSVLQREDGYPLYELTSSALNLRHPSGLTGENRFRIGRPYLRENFGEIQIRWGREPEISLSIRDLEGNSRIETSFSVTELASSTR